MRAQEEEGWESEEMRAHIVDIKNYLRSLPALLLTLKGLSVEDVVKFNVYNNIFYVGLTEHGSGYTSPVTVEIGPPNGTAPGFPLKAVASVKDGKVSHIEIVQIGSGYAYDPVITISPPDEPDGVQAEAFASPPENDIIDNISYLETRR